MYGRTQRRLSARTFILITIAIYLAGYLAISTKNPSLIKERMHPGPGAREPMFLIYALVLPAWVGQYVMAWLDVGRYHWSDRVPYRLQLAGLIGYIASYGIVFWAMWVNPFFSWVVRIQRDRGQHVIVSGPYQYVRHPAYLAALVLAFATSLALGSWLSLLPSIVWIAFIVRRTILEDRVLREELEGYKEYAGRVRYRIIPGIW